MSLEKQSQQFESHEGPPSPLVAYLREHGYPNLKTLNFVLYLTFHRNEDDAKEIVPLISACHVFIPEVNNWSEKVERAFNDIATGAKTRAEVKFKAEGGEMGFMEPLLAALANTNKAVAFADVPESSSLEEREVLGKIGLFPQDVI